MPEFFQSLPHPGAYDYIAILVMLLSMGVGLLRGVTREIASLASWAGAFLVAKFYAVWVAAHFEHSIDNSALRLALAFIATFVVTLVAIGLIGQWLAQAVRRVGLRPLDRLLGAAFGLVRGLLILIALVMLAGMTGITEQRDWRRAYSSAWLEHLTLRARALLPPALAERIRLRADPADTGINQDREG